MAYTQDKEPKTARPAGRAGVAEHDQNEPVTSPDNSSTGNHLTTYRSAAEEARQLLDELAGVEYSSRPGRPNLAGIIRRILLSPFTAIIFLFKLITRPTRRADFRLLREMRLFLRNPGHFFWFSRIAPEAAAQHFGTTSTDAMTHHARRYGAHTAMLILSILVVIFGGFGGVATQLISPDRLAVNPQTVSGNLVINGDGREIYVSSVLADNAAFVRRIETLQAKAGDTYALLAAAQNISLDTILYANNIIDPDSPIEAGQKIIVPPATGMLHIVNPGDTVLKIAELYAVDPKIIQNYPFNNLDKTDPSTALTALREVMVPGGSRPARSQLFLYKVRSGDTVKSVAEKFGLNPQTLIDNNDIDNGLKIGAELKVLPIDGLLYNAKKGDTLDGIAKLLSTSPENIVNYRPNNVTRGVAIPAGKSLIVPGGVWPPPPPPEPPKPVVKPAATPKPQPAAPGQAVQKPVAKPAQQSAKPSSGSSAGVATGRMVWPVPSRGVITTYFGQAIWYGVHKGLDIASGCGNRVIAADGGVVVESGWSPYGYGNTIVVDHGNGIKTRYAHFSNLAAWYGQRVAKGQVIGYEGTTGNSTGCHLHFEVIVGGQFRNPLAYM